MAHFQGVGKRERVMEELIIKHSRKEMTVRPAIRAAEGTWSDPVAPFGLMAARAFSHHSGVAGCRKRVGVE